MYDVKYVEDYVFLGNKLVFFEWFFVESFLI